MAIKRKPHSKETRRNLNRAKFRAARRWCQNRKVPTTFRVVGYEELN